jgi:hypothetical protein
LLIIKNQDVVIEIDEVIPDGKGKEDKRDGKYDQKVKAVRQGRFCVFAWSYFFFGRQGAAYYEIFTYNKNTRFLYSNRIT